MRKKMLFGNIMVVFLMLMVPVSSTVQYQNQEMISEPIDKIKMSEENEIDIPCGICNLEEKIQEDYPEYYELFLQKKGIYDKWISNIESQSETNPYIPVVCEICRLSMYFIIFIVIISTLGFVLLIPGFVEEILSACNDVC